MIVLTKYDLIKPILDGDKNKFYSIFSGKISFKDINSKIVNYGRSITTDAKKYVDKLFEEEAKKNTRVFNGVVFAVESMKIDDNTVHIDFERSEYKYYMATRNVEYCEKYLRNGNYFIITISTAGIIKTADNKIILGSPNENKKGYKFVGGFLDEKDIFDGKLDIEHNLKREMAEELGNIEVGPVEFLACLKKNNVVFVVYTKTPLDSREIFENHRDNFDNLEDGYEMNNMIFVENSVEEILKIINSGDLATHTTKEALTIYLEDKFNYQVGNENYIRL